ncbi:MAG: hypothetical protein WC356_01095 [Candidatus Micrarchaeia archaeon]|jgi:hypothetical protein
MQEIDESIKKIITSLWELNDLLKNNSKKTFDFEVEGEDQKHETTILKIQDILNRLKRGQEENYICAFDTPIPNFLHWEIKNEFIKYFNKTHNINKLFIEKRPRLRSKGPRPDLFFITDEDKDYWVEIQTTATMVALKNKIKQAIQYRDKYKYNYFEYIIIIPIDKLSFFSSKNINLSLIIDGNKYTDRVRIMTYNKGTFETVIEPEERGKPNIFGQDLQ